MKTILGNFVFINEEIKNKEIQGKNVLSFTKFALGGFLAWKVFVQGVFVGGFISGGVFVLIPLHESSGFPYVKDRLLSCASKSLDRIAENPLVEESISSNRLNPAWDRFPPALSVVRPVSL